MKTCTCFKIFEVFEHEITVKLLRCRHVEHDHFTPITGIIILEASSRASLKCNPSRRIYTNGYSSECLFICHLQFLICCCRFY